MRKFLLLCSMMLIAVGAWAQDINLLDQTAPVEFDMYNRPAEGVYAIKVMSKVIQDGSIMRALLTE